MPYRAIQRHWIQIATPLCALAASASAWAHEGHGMEGSHWHATDIWGLLAAAGAVALYFHRRK